MLISIKLMFSSKKHITNKMQHGVVPCCIIVSGPMPPFSPLYAQEPARPASVRVARGNNLSTCLP